MIKDVKSYVSAVGKRLSQAFSMEAFGTEEQLQFWELSAEHVSRKRIPTFTDIVSWMDLLYRAPVHFLYVIEEGKLILQRRHVITDNILKINKDSKLPHQETQQEKALIQDFEYQLQNLEKKMEMDNVFLEHGVTAHSIGQCEHIPLFTKESEFWGIYCVGPYTKCPEQIVPKMSIVGRMLSNWLQSLDEVENNPNKEYDNRIQEYLSELGSGKLNVNNIAQVILRYSVHSMGGESGALLEFKDNGLSVISSMGISDERLEVLNVSNDKVLVKIADESVVLTEVGEQFFSEWDIKFEWVYFTNAQDSWCLMIEKSDKKHVTNTEFLKEKIGDTVSQLFEYRQQNISFSKKLMDTYYEMLRKIEKSREKTQYHTPRMVAFVQRFGMFFGLEDEELEILTLTAKLHDIGYVGAVSIESDKSIGGELNHPILGAKLIEQLSVHDDVILGIRTHHEWVNGKGSPTGLKASDIPWTGKIIGLFEYVVDFIETNQDNTSSSNEELLEELQHGLMKRADINFDMVLIPTAIQLIQTMDWEGCVELGTDDES